MKTQEQVWTVLIESNPVPDVNAFGRENMDDATHLATLQKGSSEMTQLETRQEEDQRRRGPILWLAAAVLVAVVGLAVLILNQGTEEPPPATNPVPTTLAPPTTEAAPTTTVAESALADIPVWLRSGNGQWVPAQSAIPFAFTNTDGWNSVGTALTEERFTICPPTEDGRFPLCNLAIVAVLFLEPETIEETRDLLASFDGAELGEEQPITIDGAPGIRFEFTHDVASVSEQVQGEIPVPAAYVENLGSGGARLTPLGEGQLGRSIIYIVDVGGTVVTLSYQGVDTARGAAQDGFDTYREPGLAIIDSIIWGTS